MRTRKKLRVWDSLIVKWYNGVEIYCLWTTQLCTQSVWLENAATSTLCFLLRTLIHGIETKLPSNQKKEFYSLKVSKFYTEKDFYVNKLKSVIFGNVLFTDRNMILRGSLWNQILKVKKCKIENIPTDRAQIVDEKMGSFV